MISYGYPVKERDDPIVNAVEAANKQFSECCKPGAFMVDMIPLRKSRFLRKPIVRETNCVLLPLSYSTHAHNRYATSARSFSLFVYPVD